MPEDTPTSDKPELETTVQNTEPNPINGSPNIDNNIPDLPENVTPLMKWAAILGLPMLIFGYFIDKNDFVIRSLVISVGISLLFVAVGTLAKLGSNDFEILGKKINFITFGALAVWVIIFVLLLAAQYYFPEKLDNKIIQGEIKYENKDIKISTPSANLFWKEDLTGKKTIKHKFVYILDNKTEKVTINIEDPKIDNELSVTIHKDCFLAVYKKLLSSDFVVKFVNSNDGYQIFTDDNKAISQKTGIESDKEKFFCSNEVQSYFAKKSKAIFGNIYIPQINLISSAYAQESQKISDVEFKSLIADLKSDEVKTRRSARYSLAEGEASVVRRLIDEAKNSPNQYKIKLGISIALTEMLRQNKSVAIEIQKILTSDDLDFLLEYAGDKDEPLRVYTSEFLYGLGDKRLPEKSLKLVSDNKAISEDARFNYALLSSSGWDKLSESDKKILREKYVNVLVKDSSGVGKNTKAQLEKLK